MVKTSIALLLLFCTACLHRDEPQGREDPLLAETAEVLTRASANPQNAIPDSVLNAAQCVLTLPSSSTTNPVQGVASCRDGNTWHAPVRVRFLTRQERGTLHTLIVLIMTDKAASKLQGGELYVHSSGKRAPLITTTPLVTQFDLASDYFEYEVSSMGTLAPSDLSGSVRAEQNPSGSHSAIPAGISGAAKRANANYEASLQSFVNTIIPTGIVIHHTALVASEKLPNGEKEVDKFHQQRGFEINCAGRVYHVAYHYLILPNGKIQAGRPEHCEGAHARGYNSYLGISLVGDFSSRDNPSGAKGPERPPQKQLDALVQLCRTLRQKYRIPLQHILRHSDIASTDCPGDRFPFKQLLTQLETGDANARLSK